MYCIFHIYHHNHLSVTMLHILWSGYIVITGYEFSKNILHFCINSEFWKPTTTDNMIISSVLYEICGAVVGFQLLIHKLILASGTSSYNIYSLIQSILSVSNFYKHVSSAWIQLITLHDYFVNLHYTLTWNTKKLYSQWHF